MANLVDNQEFIEESSASYQSVVFKYGGIAAMIGIAIGLIMYMADMVDPSDSTISSIVQLLVFVGAIVLAIKEHREDDLGGYISFGRAFTVGILTTLFLAVINAIWTYIFMGFIAPDMVDMIMEAQMQAMADSGMGEDEIEQAMEITKGFMSPGMISVMSIFGSLFMGAIISLIVAAIMKKNSPYA